MIDFALMFLFVLYGFALFPYSVYGLQYVILEIVKITVKLIRLCRNYLRR